MRLGTRTLLLGLLAAGLAAASTASADTITFTANTGGSTEGQGNYSGSLTYTAANATTATVTVSLTNTSPSANGGYITGFVFNNPSNDISGVSPGSFSNPFTAMFANNGIAANPFGDFDLGAALGGDFLGGGSPTSGIGVGNTGTFTFNLTGTNLNSLTANSFAGALDTSGSTYFLVRFRGFNNGKSDKVPADPPSTTTGGGTTGGGTTGGGTTGGGTTGGGTTGGGTTGGGTTGGGTTGGTSGGTTGAFSAGTTGPVPTPEPTTFLLMGLGLAGFGAYRVLAGRRAARAN